jgi:CubicO group peptidase (beta-lactamase class C family)
MNRRALLLAAAACGAVTASSQRMARAQAQQRFGAAARYSAASGGAALIVVRNGVVLGEDYPNGAPDTRWPIGAATRAFAPLLAATMVEDALMSLDEPVALTIGEWGADPVRSGITVRGLLNGTSGIAFPSLGARDAATALALAPVATPGARFIDDAAPYAILAEIARRKLLAQGGETDPARYLTARTLAPIGCAPIAWTRDAAGAAHFEDGVFVCARGWAAAGELIRRGGVWRAAQLADQYALGDALRGSFAEPRAGFGFWLAVPAGGRPAPPVNSDLWRAASPAPVDLAMAAGDAGQRLYIVPSHALVIVRQTHSDAAAAPWSDAQFLSLIWSDL